MDEKQSLAVRYHDKVEQAERVRLEHERNQAFENKLVAISNFSYEPIDYSPLLVRIPWVEREIPDFSYLIEEARIKAETSFFVPVVWRIGIMLLLVFTLIISQAVVFWLAAILGVFMAISLYLTLERKRTTIEMAIAEAKLMVEQHYEMERLKIEAERLQHEESQNERISAVERLLAGDPDAIVARLNELLPKLTLPFIIEADIDIYDNVPLVRISLPPKVVIPTQLSVLLPSGRISYNDKDPREINKQYIELCASLIIQIMSVIYASIPVFDKGYVCGITKDGLNDKCVIAASIDREKVISASNATHGLAALQVLQAQFGTDTSLDFWTQELIWPPEWENVPLNMIKSLHVKIFR